MNEGLRKKIVFASLPLAIVWAVFNYPGTKSTTPVEVPSDASLQNAGPMPALRAPDARFIDIEAKQAEPWGEDPFRTGANRSLAAPRTNPRLAWVLGGIVYSHHNPLAFVNKQMVRVGDRVGQATVIEINRKSVVLEHRGRRITLKLKRG